jgi:hypothetical protein
MLLNVLRLNGDIDLVSINVGRKVVGLRITSFVVESSEEVAQLLSPEGQRWMKEHLMHRFRPVNDSPY